MPHPQPRMSPVLDVAFRSSESVNQKIAQPLLRAGEIFLPIHWPEQIIPRHLPVKRGNQSCKAVFPDSRIDLVRFHILIVTAVGRLPVAIRPLLAPTAPLAWRTGRALRGSCFSDPRRLQQAIFIHGY